MFKHLLIPNTSLRVSPLVLATMPCGSAISSEDARALYGLKTSTPR